MKTTKTGDRKGMIENARFAPGVKGPARLRLAVERLLKGATVAEVDAELARIASVSPSIRAQQAVK